MWKGSSYKQDNAVYLATKIGASLSIVRLSRMGTQKRETAVCLWLSGPIVRSIGHTSATLIENYTTYYF